MLKKTKNRIRELLINSARAGIEQYFEENPVPPHQSMDTADVKSNIDLSKLMPVELGYYGLGSGPAIRNHQLEKCRLLANRELSLEFMPKNAVCAEIGVAYGEYSEKIYDIMQPKELHLIDLYPLSPGAEFRGYDLITKSGLSHKEYIARKFADKSNIVIKQGYSDKVMATYPDDYFDYVYVDGGHSYDCVKSDIEILKKKVKNGGIIAFNDYTYFTLWENEEYGVERAVNEFLAENDDHMVLFYCLAGSKMDDIVIQLAK